MQKGRDEETRNSHTYALSDCVWVGMMQVCVCDDAMSVCRRWSACVQRTIRTKTKKKGKKKLEIYMNA